MADTGFLNLEKALIWRIVHRDNLAWILANGLHCRNSSVRDPHDVNIGSEELIDKRAHRVVPAGPGGTLADYVSFYFTPFAPMLYYIKTGYGGIHKRDSKDIVILVSSLRKVHALGLPVVFTDRHAYSSLARYFDDLAPLAEIDWALLRSRDFQRDVEDPVKVERYQAEALVHRHVPIATLRGVVCHSAAIRSKIEADVAAAGLQLEVRALPSWYF